MRSELLSPSVRMVSDWQSFEVELQNVPSAQLVPATTIPLHAEEKESFFFQKQAWLHPPSWIMVSDSHFDEFMLQNEFICQT